MANDDLAGAFGQSEPSYLAPKQKRSFWKYAFIALGVVIILGMGSCVLSLSGLHNMAQERRLATANFIEQIQENGLPAANADIWVQAAGVTEEAMTLLRDMLAHFGPANEIGETTCRAQTIASTTSKSGTFVTCSTPVAYEVTPGRIDITWLKESGDWKIYWFNSRFEDVSTYYQAETRRKIVSEALLDPVRPDVEPVED